MNSEDIRRINHIFYTSFRDQANAPHCLFVCYVLFVLRAVKYLFKFNFKCKGINEILFIVPSLNNKKSIRTIADNLPPEKITIWEQLRKDLPWALIYFEAVRHLWLFQKLYNTSSDEDKKLMRRFFMQFMMTPAYYCVFKKILRESCQIKMIVFSNDHFTINRCLLEAANGLCIKTLYVQHASVTEKFPPLHFTYSFLDGIESYEKYKMIGDIRGQVFLTGSPRFDELLSYTGVTKEYVIGVALNMLDNCDKVLELCNYLKSNVSEKIIVRPHPRMGDEFNPLLFESNGIAISNSVQESSFAFLSKIEYLIANESSIHLDAAMIGVPSLLFNFSDNEIRDWYSYIKKGLIKVCCDYEDVVNHLNSKPNLPITSIRYYVASFQTSKEGHLGEMIAEFIKKTLCESDLAGLIYLNSFMENVGDYYVYKN